MTEIIGHTDCDSSMQLQLHRDNDPDVRFPIIDDGLKLHERKQGPTSITRRAKATIPIKGFGESDWLQYIDAFQEGGDIQSASVLAAPIGTDGQRVSDPVAVFTGYLSAVGSTSGTNRATVQIYDPMKFLESIEAGTEFANATVQDVLNYVVRRFREDQPVFDTVGTDFQNPNRRVIETAGFFNANPDFFSRALVEQSINPTYELLSKKFSTNRDSLADVVTWLRERVPVKVWFGPTRNSTGITLYAGERIAETYDLTPDSNNPPLVIENGALYEMRPFNALKLKGQTGQFVDIGPLEGEIPFSGDGDYPEVTVAHKGLRDRYGDTLVRTASSNLTSEAGVRQEAESRLKQALDDVSGGSILTTLAPQLRCYDTVEATPACAGVTTDVDPLTYEIQRVTHSVTPSDNDLPESEIAVSISVDPDDIEVITETTKDAQTGGEPRPNNGPFITGLSWGVRTN